MKDSERKHLDPFTMSLNRGETFGVFNRQGDIVDIGDTPQGIFFEGSRHISLLDFELDDTKPTLLSSSIRDDNDTMTVDLANKEFKRGETTIKEGTIHIKKTKTIKNESYYESIVFRNYNRRKVAFECAISFDADFKDVFELRGFSCATCPEGPKQRESQLCFSYEGRDGIIRHSQVDYNAERGRLSGRRLVYNIELDGMAGAEVAFSVNFRRDVPKEKTWLFEGELKRKPLSLEGLKKNLPLIKTSNARFDHWILRSGLDIMALLSAYGDNVYPMAGVPWYNTPFGRDGMITCFQTLFAAPFMTKNALKFLAHYQAKENDPKADAEPGKILHELRKGELANMGALPFRKYYGAADSTFLFVWLAGIYYLRTGDAKTLNEIWPNIQDALDWAQNYADLDGDGFYEYKKRNPVGLDNQCWKDSWDSISHKSGELAKAPLALCEVQGYAYKAFKTGAKLYRLKGDKKKAEELDAKAARLKTRFSKKFWSDDLGTFAIALDGEKRKCETNSSNPGHTLSTGIIGRERAEAVSEALFGADLFSGWGVRTLGKNEKRYNPMSYHNGSVWPHDNSMIAHGLKKTGQVERFHQLCKTLFEAAAEMDSMRLPELYCGFDRVSNESPTLYPVSCSPQAWASGAVFLLIQSMLGLKINNPGKHIMFNQPTLPDYLEWLHINDLFLRPGESFSFTAKRVSRSEATVEIIDRPLGWRVSINK